MLKSVDNQGITDVVSPKVSHIVPNSGSKREIRVYQWRQDIFSFVADRLCSPFFCTIQRALGLWQWHAGLTLPERKNVTIMSDGSMTIRVKTNDGDILLSVWLILSELRIGIFVPSAIMEKDINGQIKAAISAGYDGNECSRISTTPEYGVMFDWIFRNEGIVDATLLANSLHDQTLQDMIADAIANLTTHLYMSVMNTLVQRGILITSLRGTVPNKDSIQLLVDFKTNHDDDQTIAQLEQSVRGLGIQVLYYQPQAGNWANLIVATTKESESETKIAIETLAAGLNGECTISAIEENQINNQ